MLSFKEYLVEKRRNPDLNKKIDPNEAFQAYNADGYYAEFADVNKLGVNPRQEYNTPFGIYFYPVKASIKRYGKKIENIPFANDRKYIIIAKLKSRNNVVFSSEYGWETLTKDMTKLDGNMGFVNPFAKTLQFIKKYGKVKKESGTEEALIADFIEKALRTNWNIVSHPDEALGLINSANVTTRDLSILHDIDFTNFVLYNNKDKGLSQMVTDFADLYRSMSEYRSGIWSVKFSNEPMSHLMYFTKTYANDSIQKWSNALRKFLGYEGLVDDVGKGIIHENEPVQAVFFSTKPLQHVETIYNDPVFAQGSISEEEFLTNFSDKYSLQIYDSPRGKSGIRYLAVNVEKGSKDFGNVYGIRSGTFGSRVRNRKLSKQQIDMLLKPKKNYKEFFSGGMPYFLRPHIWTSIATKQQVNELFAMRIAKALDLTDRFMTPKNLFDLVKATKTSGGVLNIAQVYEIIFGNDVVMTNNLNKEYFSKLMELRIFDSKFQKQIEYYYKRMR